MTETDRGGGDELGIDSRQRGSLRLGRTKHARDWVVRGVRGDTRGKVDRRGWLSLDGFAPPPHWRNSGNKMAMIFARFARLSGWPDRVIPETTKELGL